MMRMRYSALGEEAHKNARPGAWSLSFTGFMDNPPLYIEIVISD